MVAVMRYTVTAERGARRGWVFQCVEFPGAISEANRLSAAPALMRELIGFVADVSESDIEIDVRPVLPADLLSEIQRARAAVAALEHTQHEAAALSRAAVRDLKTAGLSGADMAEVLGISPQRVSQLVNA